MDGVKISPNESALALRAFFAGQNIDIDMSLAQDAVAVVNGRVLRDDNLPPAEASAPLGCADELGPEGRELWAVTCRVSGDDDDSLFLKWGGKAEAVQAAKQDIMAQLGTDGASGGDAEAAEDEDPPTIYNLCAEQVGVIRDGTFQLCPRLLPAK